MVEREIQHGSHGIAPLQSVAWEYLSVLIRIAECSIPDYLSQEYAAEHQWD